MKSKYWLTQLKHESKLLNTRNLLKRRSGKALKELDEYIEEPDIEHK